MEVRECLIKRFNISPRTALDFHKAIKINDVEVLERKINFFEEQTGLSGRKLYEFLRPISSIFNEKDNSFDPDALGVKFNFLRFAFDLTKDKDKPKFTKILSNNPKIMLLDPFQDRENSVSAKLSSLQSIFKAKNIKEISKMIQNCPNILLQDFSKSNPKSVINIIPDLIHAGIPKSCFMECPKIYTQLDKNLKFRYILSWSILKQQSNLSFTSEKLMSNESNVYGRFKYIQRHPEYPLHAIYSRSTFDNTCPITTEEAKERFPLTRESVLKITDQYNKLFSRVVKYTNEELSGYPSESENSEA